MDEYEVMVGSRKCIVQARSAEDAAVKAVTGLAGSGRRGRVKPRRRVEVGDKAFYVRASSSGYFAVPADD